MDYVQNYIQTLADVETDTEAVAGATAYLVKGVLFAVYESDKKPQRLSLRGDSQLIKELRERYESVVLPDNLDRSSWNTYVLTSQFDDDFITSMILHSYITSGGEYIRGNE